MNNADLVAALEAERLTGMPRWNVPKPVRHKTWEQLQREKLQREAAEQNRRNRLRIVPDAETA